MSRKILFLILLVFIFLSGVSSAHAQQSIALKIGFNFISFTVAPTETPLQLKTRVAEIEDIYLFSAAAGSFLSVNEGSLSSLGAGKGYIIKSTAAASITVAGTSVTAVSDISLKTGFNLIGISQSVSATTFSGLMKSFGIIKGLYKWSAAAGSFIQVVAGTDGTPQLLDGADPQFKPGESYFVNVYDNTTLSFTGGALSFIGGTVPAASPKLVVTGTIPALGAPSFESLNRMIAYGTNYEMGVYDSASMTEISGSAVVISGISYSATVPAGAESVTALVVIRDKTTGKIVYSALIGSLPTAAAMSAASVSQITVSGVNITGESTAIATIRRDKGIPVPSVPVASSVTTMPATIKTTVETAVTPATVAAITNAFSAVQAVLNNSGVSAADKASILGALDTALAGVLNAFVEAVKDASAVVNTTIGSTTVSVGGQTIGAASTTTEVTSATNGVTIVTTPTAGGYVMLGMKTDGDNGSVSTPDRKMFFVLANTDTKKIPSGNHTVTAPNGQVYNFSANSYNGCAVANYSYGNPKISVGSIIDPRTNPASAQHPYMTAASVAAGSETGIFKFNVNGTEVSVTNSFSYLPAMKITSHTQDSNFSVSSPVTVTWDSLGEDYVYCFTASKIPANSDWSQVSIIWSSVDVRESKFYDPVAMQKFYDGCQTTNTATIPAGIFSAGDNVDFWVQAFKKSAFTHSEAAAYGQMQMHTSSVGVQVYGR